MKPLGWITFGCIMLKAFGLIEVSWFVALTPLWFITVLSIIQVLTDGKKSEPLKKAKSFERRLKEKQEELKK